uniref:Rx N-terminal domain-containing protein n=1 Tax=Fagus sylvatica TaxID=28930 RepID=A0A2N9EU45_FAGSY
MAESAVSLVIEYLVPLLVQEARLLKGIHGKARSIKDEMEIIQSFLKDADARAEIGGMSNVEKAWVKQVREEAFHIEDLVDKYILHLSKGSHGRRQRLHFIQKIFQFTIKLKARHVIASKIQDISNNLKEKSQLAVTYRFNPTEQGRPSSGARNDTWHDPQVAALFIEEADVVGIDSPIDKLINWLVEGPSNRMVISVVGIGGLGKTTLVKKVYENDKVVAHFDSRAWITMSQSYMTEELLRDMIKQFYMARKKLVPGDIDTMKETQLMEQLRLYLHEHRGLCKRRARDITLEEVAQDYLSQLIHRSLVQVEGAPIDYIPKEVGNLFHLKYLSLRDTKVEKLPKSIRKLKNLQTLDLKRSRVSKLPVEISGLTNNDALIAELGSLGQLRKFGIYNLKRENGIALCTTLMKMSHLQSLEISATRLMDDPFKVLQALPNLMDLQLGYSYEGKKFECRSFTCCESQFASNAQCLKDIQVPDQTRYCSFLNQPEHQ